MSADSPARTVNRVPYVSGVGSGASTPVCVPPQPVTDKSFIDSVAGFINDVVPTAYSSAIDPKEQVQWARFEYTDINDLTVCGTPESESPVPPPLLLVLGYGNGVQVWSIPANGEATEVLSWRQGNVRVLRILPTPSLDSFNTLEDTYRHKRPLVALCDTIAPGPHFCSLGFISLKDGDQVKSIQFKNPIVDVLANRSSIIVTFTERIAIFDAHTLEDRMTVTTCYPSPGLCPNPVALGSRWLAYSERTMIPAWRSSGGCEGEGVPSYTATVIHAAKSFGKGLRELGESVASSLTGVSTPHHNSSGPLSDNSQPGIVTILDIQAPIEQEVKATHYTSGKAFPVESVLAHFAAHSEPIVNLAFDPTGLLLLTADKRGHDFHLFKIHPHPCGSALAAVHHLYVLHRGDTTSKVQDISFSWDSRWAAISTLRGTTHVFPITPYGGPVGVRTHATPHVVNRLSRFHRSAGLSADGRSNSPVSTNEIPSAVPYANPRLPPFPHPTIVYPLAQIRQPAQFGPGNISLQANVRSSSSRQRLASTSEDSPNLKLCSAFSSPRAWLLEPREPRLRNPRQTTDSLFIMACHGSLIQYDLDPRHATNVPREKVCDETSIELNVEAKARWTLLRQHHFGEIQAPLAVDNPLLCRTLKTTTKQKSEDEERWLSQVEIVTHAGPHRRLWMGPQFMFKTYNTSSAVPLSLTDIDAIEISVGSGSRPARSNPVNMPHGGVGARPLVPVLIESTSASSYEQSPRLLEMHRNYRRDSDSSTGAGEIQLREDLADAMMESPGLTHREPGHGMGHVIVQMKPQPSVIKVVNPIGTVITLPSDEEAECVPVPLDTDTYIHENCDETLFRPIVAAARNVVVGQVTGRCTSDTANRQLFNTPPQQPMEQNIIHCTVIAANQTNRKYVADSVSPKRVESTIPVSEPPPSISSIEPTLSAVNIPELPPHPTPEITPPPVEEIEPEAPIKSKGLSRSNVPKRDAELPSKLKNDRNKPLVEAEKKLSKASSKTKKDIKQRQYDTVEPVIPDVVKNITESKPAYSSTKKQKTPSPDKETPIVKKNWEREVKPEKPIKKTSKREKFDDNLSINKMVDQILDEELQKSSPEETVVSSEHLDTPPPTVTDLSEVYLPEEETKNYPDLTVSDEEGEVNFQKVKKSKFCGYSTRGNEESEWRVPPKTDQYEIVTPPIDTFPKPMSYAKISKGYDHTGADTEPLETLRDDKTKPALAKARTVILPEPCTASEPVYGEDITIIDYKPTMDSDENYVEAENCGLKIGETCLKTEIAFPELIPKLKSKKSKVKKYKIREEEIVTPLDAHADDYDDRKFDMDFVSETGRGVPFEEGDTDDQFLSLEPDVQEVAVIVGNLMNDFEDMTMPDESEECTQATQNESDDSIKVVKGEDIDSGDSEMLVQPTEENTLAGQLKASKKKSKKKRR